MTRILDKTRLIRTLLGRIASEREIAGMIDSILNDIDAEVEGKTKQDKINAPRYVLIERIGKVERIETIERFLMENYEIPVDALKMKIKANFLDACDTFMTEKCGNKFNGNDHLWNAFKLHWSKSTSAVVEKTKTQTTWVSPV